MCHTVLVTKHLPTSLHSHLNFSQGCVCYVACFIGHVPLPTSLHTVIMREMAPGANGFFLYFLDFFAHPGAISSMGAISPMGAISRMITVVT